MLYRLGRSMMWRCWVDLIIGCWGWQFMRNCRSRSNKMPLWLSWAGCREVGRCRCQGRFLIDLPVSLPKSKSTESSVQFSVSQFLTWFVAQTLGRLASHPTSMRAKVARKTTFLLMGETKQDGIFSLEPAFQVRRVLACRVVWCSACRQ